MTNERKPTYEELEAENARLKVRVDELLKRIEEIERSKKRQAAPFGTATDEQKKKPKKRGRRRGQGKWMRAEKPSRVDEILEAVLPTESPCCGGAVTETRVADQYQTELPPIRPWVRHFRVHVGECACCGKRIQGRHALQTSDALGAASVQLGPRVLALGAVLNKTYGMSWERVASFIKRTFGIKAASSTYCRAAIERLARRATPLFEALMDEVASSAIVTADETGWRVDGESAWLWVLTTPDTTVYSIDRSRSWAVPAEILGPDWSGTLVRDGYATYRQFTEATHQTCLAHLLRRAKNLLKTAKAGAARFPHFVKRVLKAALALRDRREELTPHGFASLRGRLRAQLERMFTWTPTHAPNARFLKHLRNEREALLTFLDDPRVPATNWRAEQGLRPAVINRKLSAGNRTYQGAAAQSTLMSVLRTCGQRGLDGLSLFEELLRGTEVRAIASPS